MTRSKIIYHVAGFESNCPTCVASQNFERMKIREGELLSKIDGSDEYFGHSWHLDSANPKGGCN